MLPYTFSALQSDLQGFLHSVSLVSPSYYLAFRVCHAIGCRFNEVREINRWLIVDASNFSLKPQKGNNNRILPLSKIPPEYVLMVSGQNTYFEMLRQSTASNYFRSYYFGKRIFHEDKQLTTNLFRHHFCKRLFAEGYTPSQISTILGERVQQNTDNYIYSDLMYEARN